MSASNAILLTVSTLVFLYVGFAMFRPERFWMGFFWTIVVMVVLLGLAWRYLGAYMVSVYEGRMSWLGWVERPIYRALRVDPEAEQSWQRYTGALIISPSCSIRFVR